MHARWPRAAVTPRQDVQQRRGALGHLAGSCPEPNQCHCPHSARTRCRLIHCPKRHAFWQPSHAPHRGFELTLARRWPSARTARILPARWRAKSAWRARWRRRSRRRAAAAAASRSHRDVQQLRSAGPPGGLVYEAQPVRCRSTAHRCAPRRSFCARLHKYVPFLRANHAAGALDRPECPRRSSRSLCGRWATSRKSSALSARGAGGCSSASVLCSRATPPRPARSPVHSRRLASW